MGEPALKLVETGGERAASTQDFLRAMRGVAASVTVVTTNGPMGRQGATVSSFTSVSVDPPTVLACLARTSRIAGAVRANRRFAVNVLSHDMDDLGRRFSDADAGADRFAGVAWDMEDGLPLIRGCTAFLCDLTELAAVATHDVFFGRVAAVHHGGKAPLAYLDRTFARVVPL